MAVVQEEKIEIDADNQLRVRAATVKPTPQESFDYFVDRMMYAKGWSLEKVLGLALTRECQKILGVERYTGNGR